MDHRFFDVLPPEARAIREEVFIQEQGFQEEFDEWDDRARHLLVYDEKGDAAATARIFPMGDRPGYFYIGRVSVRRAYRGLGLGARLLCLLEQEALARGGEGIALSAQCQARPFYEKQGYTASGDVYLDEHCPHIHMEKQLGR